MSIFVIGISIAIPSFTNMGRKNVVKMNARKIKDSLFRSRMKAVELNESVVFEVDEKNNSYFVKIKKTNKIIEEYQFEDVNISINIPSDITWNSKGNTSDACTINVVGNNSKYNIIISSVGNVRIFKP
jgi:Tfp pilus assembly protein FimT